MFFVFGIVPRYLLTLTAFAAEEGKTTISDFLTELDVKGKFIPVAAVAPGMRDEWKREGEIEIDQIRERRNETCVSADYW